MSASLVRHVFVYGTLQRGQSRERCWPQGPVAIDEATIHAALYDLGPYPAIGPGEDVVRGELWEIAAEHLEQTLRVLDEVEGYSQIGADLYVRRLVTCRLDDGSEVEAWTYYYANESKLPEFARVKANRDGGVLWRQQPVHLRSLGG